jgi:hypothetical protein
MRTLDCSVAEATQIEVDYEHFRGHLLLLRLLHLRAEIMNDRSMNYPFLLCQTVKMIQL